MTGKIRAAVAARRDPDFVIIARTDAAAVHGLPDALARAHAYAEAGADLLFVEAPTDEAAVARVAGELRGHAPLVFNWAEGGRTPPLGLERIGALGFTLVLFPIGTLLAATAGIRALLAALRRDGTPAAALPGLPSFGEFTDLVGLPEIDRLGTRFGDG
jgi:2-methylisocitrate lyase-like PEP mutase family enzyme